MQHQMDCNCELFLAKKQITEPENMGSVILCYDPVKTGSPQQSFFGL